MPTTRRRDFVIGVCLFVALLLVTAVAQYRETLVLWNDAHLAFHAHEFVEALDDLLLTVREAETGHTYYMMTGEDKYLKSYAMAIDSTKAKIESIKQLAANSVEERNRIPRVQTLLSSEMHELAASLALRNEKGVDAVQLAAFASRETSAMGAFQTEVQQVQQFEQGLLSDELQAHSADHRWAVLTVVIATALILASFAALLWVLRRRPSE